MDSDVELLVSRKQVLGYGTTGRGVRREVHVSELTMSQGGVLRKDRRLKEEDFLIETVTPEEIKWIILPFNRGRIFWDLFMFVLVGYTAAMLPIQLAYPDATESM